MRLFLEFLLILFLWGLCAGKQHLYAQKQSKPHIDSILQALPKANEDTNEVLLLDDLSFSYYTIAPDEGLKYGQKELRIAQKLGWEKGIALAYNSIGDNYLTKSDFAIALDYYFNSAKINEELGNKLSLAKNYNHIGVAYKAQKNYPEAMGYYLKALKINEEQRYKNGIAVNLGNIGNIYCFEGDYPKALEHHFRSLKMYEELGDNDGIAHLLGNIGLVYKHQNNYDKALEYYFNALQIAEGVSRNETDIILGNIGDCYLQLAKGTTKTNRTANLVKAISYLKKSIDIGKEVSNMLNILEFSKNLSEAEALAGNDKEAFERYKQYAIFKDSVFSIENNEKILMIEYDRKRHSDSLKAADEKRVADLNLQHERNYTYIGIPAILLLLGFSFFIIKERAKSEKLLLNILPAEVAAELKSKGVTKARHFDNVTVLFTDFVNFTKVGERMSPQMLIDELNTCFKAFDEITARYHVEKIKTIGDAYLAIAGLPAASPLHAEHIVKTALEINAFMNDRKAKMGDKAFEIRIGIHSGSVVAGIVGVKKFAYDIWGDTVNTAARMQQNSEPGKINISQTTYELVKNKFECTYRGEIVAKNKGQLKMYFVS